MKLQKDRSDKSTSELLREEIDFKKIVWLQIREIMIAGRLGVDRTALVDDLETLLYPYLDKQYDGIMEKEWESVKEKIRAAQKKDGKPDDKLKADYIRAFSNIKMGELTKLMHRRGIYPQMAEESIFDPEATYDDTDTPAVQTTDR